MTKENNITNIDAWDENGDLSYVIDSMLNAPELKNACSREAEYSWILLIGNKDLADGISSLPPLEQEILKLFFLDGLTLIDIASKLDIPASLICGHIKSMKVRLRCYV